TSSRRRTILSSRNTVGFAALSQLSNGVLNEGNTVVRCSRLRAGGRVGVRPVRRGRGQGQGLSELPCGRPEEGRSLVQGHRREEGRPSRYRRQAQGRQGSPEGRGLGRRAQGGRRLRAVHEVASQRGRYAARR